MMMNRTVSRRVPCVAVILLALAAMVLPGSAGASSHEDGGVAAEIKAMIMEASQFTRKNLKDQEGGISKDGALHFWSSGGLMQRVAPDSEPVEYDFYANDPKHIKVIELPGGESAVAMYYSEGTFKEKGRDAVGHYMTRVLEVYVKEDGEWVNRAAHWSPVAGGSGTKQTAVD